MTEVRVGALNFLWGWRREGVTRWDFVTKRAWPAIQIILVCSTIPFYNSFLLCGSIWIFRFDISNKKHFFNFNINFHLQNMAYYLFVPTDQALPRLLGGGGSKKYGRKSEILYNKFFIVVWWYVLQSFITASRFVQINLGIKVHHFISSINNNFVWNRISLN